MNSLPVCVRVTRRSGKRKCALRGLFLRRVFLTHESKQKLAEAHTRAYIDPTARREVVPELRKQSRYDYLIKREKEKLQVRVLRFR
jgi:hypothetical protein